MSKDIPRLLPTPLLFEYVDGSTKISNESRIIADDPSLENLAQIFTQEIYLLTGVFLKIDSAGEKPNNIILKIDTSLEEEEYMIQTDTQVMIKGGSYIGVAWGTVTLLQVISSSAIDNEIVFDSFRVEDKPFAPYRGLMIDVARNWHDIEVIKQMVLLCRWFKVKYLQLHMTDDQSFTFPSTAFLDLATPGRHYTKEQLIDLEKYASDRGVIIIPEIEMPGHAASFVNSVGYLFSCNRNNGGDAICVGHEDVYNALDTLIGEVCSIFKSTPYFHFGADEVNESGWMNCARCMEFMEKNAIDGVEELYRYFIVRMNDIVKKHG